MTKQNPIFSPLFFFINSKDLRIIKGLRQALFYHQGTSPRARIVPVRLRPLFTIPAFIIIYLIVLSLILSPVLSQAEEISINSLSERLEFFIPQQKAIAEGDVVMQYNDITFKADTIQWEVLTGNGTAFGNVCIELPQGSILETPMAEFNVNTGLWKIYNADIWLTPTNHLSCEYAEQIDPNTIYLKKLKYTTCLGKKPPWEIVGKEGIFKLYKHLNINRLSFKIKGVTMFYIPLEAHVPLYGKKISGIQPPITGHSSRHGYFIKTLFTWPLIPQTDGQFFLDFFSHTGCALGIGWMRQKNDQGKASEAKLYLLRERISDKSYVKIDLFLNSGTHTGTQTVFDVHSATTRDFNRRFSLEPKERDALIEESKAFVIHQKYPIGILADIEHVRSTPKIAKNEFSIVPHLSCTLPFSPFRPVQNNKKISPLFGFKLATEYITWKKDSDSGETESYSVQPKLIIPFHFKEWIGITPMLMTKNSYLQTSKGNPSGWSHTHTFDLALAGPKFFKDLTPKVPSQTSANCLRHLIYPEINYIYKKHQGIEIYPNYITNTTESPSELESLSFLLVNRVWELKADTAQVGLALLDFTLSHTIEMEEKRHTLTLRVNARPHPLIDIHGIYIGAIKGYKHEDIDTGLGIGKKDKGGIEVNWRYLSQDNTDRKGLNTLQCIISSMTYKGYQLKTTFLYNLKSNSRIEEEYSLVYQSPCWKGLLAFIHRYDENLVRLNLDLLF